MKAARASRSDAYIPVDTDSIVGGSKLLGEMRGLIRRKHYHIRTEQAYLGWIRRYPNARIKPRIIAFLNHLAVKRQVAASTQNQALNARGVLYKQLLTRGEIRRHHIGVNK